MTNVQFGKGVLKQKVCDIIKGMKCKRCEKEDKQIKAEKTMAGSQIYKYKHCGKTSKRKKL